MGLVLGWYDHIPQMEVDERDRSVGGDHDEHFVPSIICPCRETSLPEAVVECWGESLKPWWLKLGLKPWTTNSIWLSARWVTTM